MNEHITNRERWLAGICYLPFLVFVSMLATDKSNFLSQHCRQGFALLFVELAAAVFITIIEHTFGQIPIAGFILVFVLQLILALGTLTVSVMGFFRAVFGEQWRIPFVDDLASKIPIE